MSRLPELHAAATQRGSSRMRRTTHAIIRYQTRLSATNTRSFSVERSLLRNEQQAGDSPSERSNPIARSGSTKNGWRDPKLAEQTREVDGVQRVILGKQVPAQKVKGNIAGWLFKGPVPWLNSSGRSPPVGTNLSLITGTGRGSASSRLGRWWVTRTESLAPLWESW